uniref:Protein kinase domain-containing protein n=1 Tax=Arundo donax TaxID=35708 RepID=A0A0A9HUQ1_ARUDO
MKILNIRATYVLAFSLLVYERLGSCASINKQGRAHSRFRKGVEEDATETRSNWGVSRSDDGKVITLTIQSAIQRRLLHPKDQHGQASSIHAPGEQPHVDPSSKSTGLEPKTNKSFTLPQWAIYTLAISGVLILVVVATTIYMLFSHRKKDNTVMPWSSRLSGPLRNAFVTGVPSLGRAELETACEDFINVIGTSSDCTLYKGTLSSGVEIAVISTSVNSAQDWLDRSEEQFRNKVSVLSRVNHKNFMNLLSYCTCNEPFTRMMVFEYAPCGSLFEHLHIREAEDLDWPTRLRIIMGIAYCLEHMSQLDPPVMPTTLSSSSIYLTDDYAAKISDIKFWKDNKDTALRNSSTNQQSIVYKFGILLLEVISGRLPFSEDHGLLVLWASSYLDGKRPLAAMAVPTLKLSVPVKDVASLCDVVRVCINPEKEKRPNMAEVARMIRGVTALSPEQATSRDSPLWWAELEIASSETG